MLAVRRLALCAALTSGGGGLVSARVTPSRSLASALNLRGGQLQACFFDFDGTLAQSEDTHRQTFSELLGFELTPDYWNAKCVGNSPRSILEKHLAPERLAAGETVDGLLQRRTSLFEEHIEAGKLEATRGAQRIVAELRARGVPCAVVSSGERSYIVKALRAMGLLDMFQAIVSGDDPDCSLPGRHKPSPYMYLRGCEALGVSDPSQCIAFEDSLAGIKSAQAAGIPVVAMLTAVTDGIVPDPTDASPHAAALGRTSPVAPVAALVADFDAVPRALLA